MAVRKKIILDLDTGIDDAMALAYALGSPELELIGITGTYGNVTVDQGILNSLAILELFGRQDIPVFAGPAYASTLDEFSVLEISAFIHGENGIGQAVLPEPNAVVEETSAIDFLIAAVQAHRDDLVIVPTGPSTTIAAAMEQSQLFADHARIVMMGGALTVPGNVHPWAEANVIQDPEATNSVFRRASDLTMVGLDVTMQTLLTSQDTLVWRELGTTGGQFLADAADFYIKAYETTAPYLGGCGLHDPLAVAVALDPTLVTCLSMNLKVDVEGEMRGRTIADETRLLDPIKTGRVAVEVNVERFLAEFMERLTRLARDTPAL